MNKTKMVIPNTYSHGLKFGIITYLLFGFALSALAAELPKESVLPLSQATKAAQASIDKCKADGYNIGVTVVDRGGNVRITLRNDGAGPHTVDSSRKKAYSAVSLKRPTGDVAAMIVKMPAIQGMQFMNEHMLLLAGGLPIEIGKEFVGGIGVGGAPGGHLDAACAQAGLDSIGAANKLTKGK